VIVLAWLSLQQAKNISLLPLSSKSDFTLIPLTKVAHSIDSPDGETHENDEKPQMPPAYVYKLLIDVDEPLIYFDEWAFVEPLIYFDEAWIYFVNPL